VGAPQHRGHRIDRAPDQPNHYAPALAYTDPHPHAATHNPFAHAVADQPVTVPHFVRAGSLAIGGIADGERARLPGTVRDIGPAVGAPVG
jgi:hypothetical protein